MLRILAFTLILMAQANAATHNCYHSYQLRSSLNLALPGDEIVLFPGRYLGNFDAYNNGQQENPITIRSHDPTNKAIIDGITYNDQYTIGLYVAANYWTVKDLIIENANKGVVFENSLGGQIVDCEVRKTGKCRATRNDYGCQYELTRLARLQEKKQSTFATEARMC